MFIYPVPSISFPKWEYKVKAHELFTIYFIITVNKTNMTLKYIALHWTRLNWRALWLSESTERNLFYFDNNAFEI